MVGRSTGTVCLFLLLTISGWSQSIDSLMELYHNRVPQEKIFIHFDNSAYATGQTIWYKVYVVQGTEPATLSKNFYLDWFDANGNLLQSTIAPVIGSVATGSFTVPARTGTHLQLLGYTKWMLNFDSAFLFHKIIPIAETDITRNAQAPVLPATTLRFFPEGGDMIENLTGTIAFKAQQPGGIPVTVDGVIRNKSGQPVATFQAVHNGMGKFDLRPVPGDTYTAEWKDALGNIRQTVLPVANAGGILLKMNQFGFGTFSVERPPGEVPERFKKVSIVAHMDGHVVYRAMLIMTGKEKVVSQLPVLDLPSGVLQFTVFDAERQPVAERIVFINNHEYNISARLTTDTVNLARRGKNVYEIEIPDSVATSLSCAVIDGAQGIDSSRNIVSDLLLSSEIRGYIHDPAYYFLADHDSLTDQLDLVMLTNGWRRFRWEDVWNKKSPAFRYQPDTGYLSISGNIDRLSDNKIKQAETVNLILVAKDSSQQFLFTPLKPDGSFREDNLVLFDTTKIYYQLNKVALPVRSQLTMNNGFLPRDPRRTMNYLTGFLPDTTGLGLLQAAAREQRRLDILAGTTTLKEVVVHAKIKSRLQEMDEKYTQGLFSRDGYQLNVADDMMSSSYGTVFTYLRAGHMPAGMLLLNAQSDAPSLIWRRFPVALFLNEVPVDASTMTNVYLSDVAYIKVLRPPFYGAIGGGGGGALAVYTRKGDELKGGLGGLEHILLPGYTPIKQFYSPDYAEAQRNAAQPDLRQTLYWDPNMQTDGENRKLRFSFYNNDLSHSLRVTIEGLSADGRMIHISKLLN